MPLNQVISFWKRKTFWIPEVVPMEIPNLDILERCFFWWENDFASKWNHLHEQPWMSSEFYLPYDFWGFWGSLAPPLVGKSSLAPYRSFKPPTIWRSFPRWVLLNDKTHRCYSCLNTLTKQIRVGSFNLFETYVRQNGFIFPKYDWK